MANPVGRPLQYKTPEELEEVVNLYFEHCKINLAAQAFDDACTGDDELITDDAMPTITGLALALNLTRQSLLDYQGKEEFLDTVKKAKARVEAFVEQRLYHNNATGCIFNLKNNFGWKDKTETELSGGIRLHELTEEQLDAKLQALINAG